MFGQDDRSITNNLVGNLQYADSDSGFKDEVKHVFESYSAQGVDLVNDMLHVISSPTMKENFIGSVTESLTDSPLFTNPACANAPFYNNYNNRVEQLLDNTLATVATESAMIGYAPIVAYNPFFLKKQWIDCVFKDVLMTEIPKTPVVNIGFERRYLKDLQGHQYPLPECLYDDALVKSLMDSSTGLNINEDPIEIDKCKALYLLTSDYITGLIADGKTDLTVELTPNIHICKVIMDNEGEEVEVPVNITVDVTTHNFVKGAIKYDILDEDGSVSKTLTDEIVGNVNFDAGTITAMSTTGVVTKICLRGKTANRWNQRSLDVVRTVEQIQKVMPESGPRLNSAITIEDAADALALQNIDQIADNINIMGATLANFEDAEIKMFLVDSFKAQEEVSKNGILYNEIGDNIMIARGSFDTLPYDTYHGRITEWMKDAREYFERMIAALKVKLRSTNILFVAVAHPNTVRFLQDGINWVFSDDTQISGVKLSYNFGIYTTAQDRVHMVTSMRVAEDEGIRFIGIPLTQELITFKHWKYNVVIDRNYRNPLYTLVPNIMCTQRTLTFEILPVQGVMTIENRSLVSPTTLKRATTDTTSSSEDINA
jgi:hypothetical protein